MEFNTLEMSNGTKYRVLVDLKELIDMVDQALKTGGLMTVPCGTSKPGSPVTINPQHVVIVSDYRASIM
jgi:hypothetical protein